MEYDEFDLDDVGELTDIPPKNVESEEDQTVTEQEEQVNGNTTTPPQVDKNDSTSEGEQNASGGDTNGGNTNSGAGGGELLTEFRYEGYHTSDDVTYVVTYKEYNVEDDTETGRTGEMKVINSNGNMTIVSNVIS